MNSAMRANRYMLEEPGTTLQETVSVPCRLIAGETVGCALGDA